MAMTSKIVGFIVFSTGAGTLVPLRAYNATVTRTADGDYDVTLGQGGVDSLVCEIASAVTSAGVAGGAGTARILNVFHTSDTVKRLIIRDDTGALAAISAVSISFRRLPPLPAP